MTTFYLTEQTRDDVKRLAASVPTSSNAFVEGLIRRYGSQYAADLVIARDSLKGTDADTTEPVGSPAGAAAD